MSFLVDIAKIWKYDIMTLGEIRRQEETKMYGLFKGGIDILFYALAAVIIIGGLITMKKNNDKEK